MIALGVLSITLISNHFFVSAEIIKPIPPEDIIGEITNEKIKEYNQKVEQYNLAVDQYNKEVDEQYQIDVLSVQQQNQEIERHNEEERNKVAQIQASNEQKQIEYDSLYKQYQKDLSIEKQLQEIYGYESTAAYNDYANTHYNNVADTAIEKNADSSRVFDIDKSYNVTPSENTPNNSDNLSTDEIEEETPATVKVHIEHSFLNTEQVYTKDFEILETDIITFYAAGAQLEPIDNSGTCAFFMYSPEDLRQGYWYETGSVAYDTANYKDSSGWQNGNTYVLSYKDGKHHPNDSTDIDMIYEYTWIPINRWPIYNVPNEPTLELDNYTPNYQEKIADPIQPEHLEHLPLKDLIEEPTPAEPEPEPKPDNPKKKKKKHKKENKNKEEQKKEEQPKQEENKEEKVAETQVKDPKPAPAQPPTSTIVNQTPSARRANTGDHSVIKFRIAILTFCSIVLILIFYPWKKKK